MYFGNKPLSAKNLQALSFSLASGTLPSAIVTRPNACMRRSRKFSSFGEPVSE